MTEFLAPMNDKRARDVLAGLNDYHEYNHENAEKAALLLRKSYPMVFSKLQEKSFTNDSILLETQGSGITGPLVFLCHLDTVDEEFSTPSVPLSRAHFIALLEALEGMLYDGYIPSGDLVLCLSMDSLSGGKGAQSMADYLRIRSIHPCFVLDGGGYVSEESFRTFLRRTTMGMQPSLALVGITEKGELRGEITPRLGSRDPSGDIIRAAAKLSRHRVKTRLCNATRQMLTTIARQSTLARSWMLKYPRLNSPLLRLLWKNRTVFRQFFQQERFLQRLQINTSCKRGPEGGTISFRQTLLPGTKCSVMRNQIRKALPHVNVEIPVAMDASQRSVPHGESWDALTTAIQIQFEHALVVPCLSPYMTDARFFRELGPSTYRFSPFLLSDEEATDELCTLTEESLQKAVQFFRGMLSV